MYYKDQLQKHLGRDSEVCDYVIRLPDAKYDVALIKNTDGTYSPVFDAWLGSVGKQLGVASEPSSSAEDTHLHSIGKFMQGYSKFAAMNVASGQGYRVSGCRTDAKGNVHLEIDC